MSSATAPRVTGFSRFVLAVLVLPLLFIAGVQLLILTEHTDVYFAWTIKVPLIAAFLGAGYWAAMAHTALGMRRGGSWPQLRTSMPAALTATVLLAVATFLHIDQFNFNAPAFITRFVTWVWLVVYLVVPPVLLAAWVIQARMPGANARGDRPFPGWMRSGFFVLGGIAVLTGLALFFLPDAMGAVWPWKLPPLGARVISSWTTAFGVACVSVGVENDLRNSLGTMASLCLFTVLELIVLARYAPGVDWANPVAWVWVLGILFGLGLTALGLWKNRGLN